MEILGVNAMDSVKDDVFFESEEGEAEAAIGCCVTDDKCNLESTDDSVCIEKELTRGECVNFKVHFNKIKYDVNFDVNSTVRDLKSHLETIIGVPSELQKVMIKGLAKNEDTLISLGVTEGCKVMVVGSRVKDILAVAGKDKHPQASKEEKGDRVKEPLCKQKQHKSILDKGMPSDLMVGIKDFQDNLPHFPITGINGKGHKVRLTFKVEQDELWIGTKERTDKIPLTAIKNIITETIEEHEEYQIMGFQLGPTEASRYWVYWIPSQYTEAIKDIVLGKWQYF